MSSTPTGFYDFAIAILLTAFAGAGKLAEHATAPLQRPVRSATIALRLVLMIAIVSDVLALGRGRDNYFDATITLIAILVIGGCAVIPSLAADGHRLGLQQRHAWVAAAAGSYAALVIALRYG